MERRRFSRELKLAAVKKILKQGLSHHEVARELGIRNTYQFTIGITGIVCPCCESIPSPPLGPEGAFGFEY